MQKRLAVFISGTGTLFQALIDAIRNGEINAKIALAVCSNDTAYGLTRAKENGIDTRIFKLTDYSCAQDRDSEIAAVLKEYSVDLVVLAGYLGILTRPLLSAYSRKIINIHPALLPKYGGKGFFGIHVHNAVIAAGESVSGATTHYVEDGIDTGEIIMQQTCRVEQNDTPQALQQRILQTVETGLLVETVKMLCK